MILPNFDGATYYFDFIALSFVLLPALVVIRAPLYRRILFIFAGLYLLYMVAPRLMLFYMIYWIVVALFQHAIAAKYSHRVKTVFFWVMLLVTLSPMLIWKVWSDEVNIAFNILSNDFLSLVSQSVWEIDLARNIILPIGLSFATFRAVDLLVKTYVGRFKSISIDRILFYGFFPSVQVVGPIIEYEEIQKQCNSYVLPNADDVFQGLLRIAIGLLKVFVIASILQSSSGVFHAFGLMNLVSIWLSLIAFTWFFYLNFSGYSDLAIGLSRLYGFKLKENFNHPYFRTNIAEFWNNWHMSLSRFAQRNAFVPLGGYRGESQYLAVFATIMVIALWHDITWSMLVFGAYHGIGLIVHRFIANRSKVNIKRKEELNIIVVGLKVLSTYLFVVISFPLLVLNINNATLFYLSLFGLNS